MKIYFLIYFFSFIGYSQSVKISGNVKDRDNRSIEGASVILYDSFENIITYSYSQKDGMFSLNFNAKGKMPLKLSVSSYSFANKKIIVDLNSKTFFDVILEEKVNNLTEVIINSDNRVKIDKDTTTIKVAKFSNKTEQTVEDFLRKLPGIEVLNDGTIKAHGKNINKLLVDGDDLFSKNYKILSKNLDANVLNEVQIIDNFEDNPILKKLSKSDKVAINLKLKANKQNIWFGNVVLGAGIISENRWKESLNIGLIRKKIKIFNFSDYNNSGERARDLFSNSILENDTFGEDKYEKTANGLFSIASNENTTFSKSQSILNKTIFNSLSFNRKLNSKFSARGLFSFANDNQKQQSTAETKYIIAQNPIIFNEHKDFNSENILFSGEIELKYVSKKNYYHNLLIIKNTSSDIKDNLLFNNDAIKQTLNNQNLTFYNHLQHTTCLTKKSVLNNYFYFGLDKNLENANISSRTLSQLFTSTQNNPINQNAKNKIFNIGAKSKIISKFNNFDNVISVLFEKQIDLNRSIYLNYDFRPLNKANLTNLTQNIIELENVLRYNFNQKVNLSATLNATSIYFNVNESRNIFTLINPNITLRINKTALGSYTFAFYQKSTTPSISNLVDEFQLSDYRNFTKGTNEVKPLRVKSFFFKHHFYNDEKRFAVNSELLYSKSDANYNLESALNEEFNYNNFFLGLGSTTYNCKLSYINYFKKIKIAAKISTDLLWTNTPFKINDEAITIIKNQSRAFKITALSYFSLPLNFDFGIVYNFNKSVFRQISSDNTNNSIFLNINYKINKFLIAEFNTIHYRLIDNYTFMNSVISYTPDKSKISYRLVLNNLTNENKFKINSITNYTNYTSSINLVPRYFLATMRYRF